jgi:uncharacterized protein (TIGR03083 family)
LASTAEMARDERERFASFLDGLTPQQWNSPTLCELWTVRDVAIHTVSYDELSTAGLVGRFLKGRLNTDRINAIGVADYADRSPEQITALIRAHAQPHGLTGGFGGKIALTDGMIHQQDIRRSIGLPRTIDPARLRTRWISRASPRPFAVPGGRAVYALSPPTWIGRTARVAKFGGAARPCLWRWPAAAPHWTTSMARVKPNSPNGFDVRVCDYTAARPVIGGRSLRVTMPGGAATTAGTALITGIAV